ncbi:HET-domain-containing protein, partial [Periconia macrospinosa]
MTAETSKSYVYSSLFDTEFKRPFRILWLQPSEDFDTPLRCRLTTHDLTWKQTPWIQYEALSYSWNSPTHSETPLLCEDGLQLPITKSLNSALRHLRQPESVRRLWIDQVCINQTDLDEKSHQIAQMKAIYSRSTYILIWLGEESHSGEQVLRFLMSLNKSRINIKDQLLHFFPKNGLSALEHFFSRAWFHRRWVIQE